MTKVDHLQARSASSAPAAPRPRSSPCAARPASRTSRPAPSRSASSPRPPTRPPAASRRRRRVTGADGSALTGKGVSVGVIDSGVDPTHPYFKEADGSSAVVASYKTLCDPTETSCSVQKLPNTVDTDTLSLGGHGTHVNGIVAGRPTSRRWQPSSRVPLPAPSSSTSRPAPACSSSVPTPPSTGCSRTTTHPVAPASRPAPARRSRSPTTPTARPVAARSTRTPRRSKIQRALAAEGVVTVWANGNDGGDGSEDLSNPPGKDPTGGVISVASFFDQDNGTRDGTVSDFSSRGKAGDQSTYPDISAPGREHHLVLPALPADLLDRARPAERSRPHGHRHLQHDQRHLDGGPAHRRHRGAAVPGQPVGDPGTGRERAEDDGLQVHQRCAVRVRRRSAPPASTRATAWSTWWQRPRRCADGSLTQDSRRDREETGSSVSSAQWVRRRRASRDSGCRAGR